MLIGIFTVLYVPQNENSKKDEIVRSSQIISEPIVIDEAQDWIDLKNQGKCTGQGTQLDPYIINNLKINGKGSNCILIDSVTGVYYKIMNCELYNGSHGINISYASVGDIIGNDISYNYYGIETFTSSLYASNKIFSGNIISHNEYGMRIMPLFDSEISYNNVTHNVRHGINLLDHNERVTISNNIISHNDGVGLYLISVDDSTIEENVINYNGRGIELRSCSNNAFNDNSINYNIRTQYNHAFAFFDSNQNTATDNIITDNGGEEFYFSDSSDNSISNNDIIESSSSYYFETGVCTGNEFINNNILYDDRYEYNDFFYDAYRYSIKTEYDLDDLVSIDEDWYRFTLQSDTVYEISINVSESGDYLDLYIYDENQAIIAVNSSDEYYITVKLTTTITNYYYIRVWNGNNNNYHLGIHLYQEQVPEIKINYPTSGKILGKTAPAYNVSITGSYEAIWYTLDGGLTNIIASGLIGFISQVEWDKKGNGIVSIIFYVNNSHGLINSDEIPVEKYVSPDDSPNIPGYNLLIIVPILAIITVVSVKKKRLKVT